MIKMIKDFFAGRVAPVYTYLIGVFAMGIVFRQLGHVMNAASVYMYLNWNETLVDVLCNGLYVVNIGWLIVMAVVFWRSIHFESRPSGFNWLGMGLIMVGIGSVAHALYVNATGNGAFTASQIQAEISSINASLPQHVDEETVLTWVSYDVELLNIAPNGDKITRADYLATRHDIDPDGAFTSASDVVFRYHYDLSATGYEGVDLLELEDGFEICQDLQAYFRGPVTRLEAVYTAPDATFVSHMNGDDCLAVLGLEK